MKLLMACMCFAICSGGNINAMETALYQDSVNDNSVDSLYSEIQQDFNNAQKLISKISNERVYNNTHLMMDTLKASINEFCNDPYGGNSVGHINHLIKNRISYIDKAGMKECSADGKCVQSLEQIKSILHKISDKFNQIVEIIENSNDIPIDLEACKELLAKLNNDNARILNKYDDLNMQYAQINKIMATNTNKKKAEQLVNHSNRLSNKSLELSNHALSISNLLNSANKFYNLAQELKNDKNSRNEYNVIECYKVFINLYHELKGDPETKQIWDKLTPFFNYVIHKYHNTIENQNLPIG